MQKINLLTWLIAFSLFLTNCSEEPGTTENASMTDEEVLAIYAQVYGASNIYIDGDYVVVKSDGVPDHKSPYFDGTTWEATQFEAYNSNAFKQNPNKIGSQNFVFTIPKNPKEASSKSATGLGAIGVSINGIPFYNQYAGPSQPLTNEIESFDQYSGHPDQGSRYHYHVEPVYLTTSNGKSSLLGFLLDGFPVYGPQENGKTITNSDLDDYHGHTSATAEFPGGIYHYHITSTDPYINGNGFFGTPGTISQ
jgi:hypothetical protein